MSGIPAGAGQLLGKRLGKFEILALLALGGTAEIYLARIGGAAGFEKYVVVKCLHDHLADDPEFVKMFLDEARLAAHLDHSNIVQTMELGQHDGRYYMVMEFLAGQSLAMIVRRATERLPNNRIPVPLVLNILAQSCAGLHYAHEKAMNGKALNIVHRDTSPQNLVISFEGVVKVVDFGIAKAELRETRTRSGTIKGKFAYMSPEQCVANNVDRRTDVFALGVIGHELLTGQRLFKRPSPYETYQAVIECDVKPPSTSDAALDPALDPVIMRAVAKDKEERYPTAEAFGDALLGYLHHRGIGSGPGDVSRFFDAYFGQEIEEHSMRMRELISGRDLAIETGVSWGGDDAEDDARRDHAAGKPSRKPTRASDLSRVRESGEIEQLQRPSAGSLSRGIDDMGGGSRIEGDDEMPAERTRIESNPLEQLNELDRLVSSKAAQQSAALPKLPPSGPLALPAPPPGPMAKPSPRGMPPSGRFPDLANLPTMIAEPPPDGAHPAASGALPASAGLARGSTGLANQPLPALDMTQVAPLPMGRAGTSSPPGYPVLNAQIATGAPVLPSEDRSQPHAAPPAPQAVLPSAPYAAPRGPTPGGMLDGYPQVAPPRVPDSGPGQEISRDGNPHDAHRAANVVSPVGSQYSEHVDWGAAAAVRARAVHPWMLAVLFVGALGVALALTIVIARIVS
jgi:serine/threonine-protein kinase